MMMSFTNWSSRLGMVSLMMMMVWMPIIKTSVAQVKFDCDPCIKRDSYKIQAILHGSAQEPFWQQMESSMMQASKDMNIDLSVSLAANNEDQMVGEITAATANGGANALIVSIPSPKVQSAVEAAIANGTPVFGLESGYDLDIGLSAFIGMDNVLGGQKAAEQIKSSATTTPSQAVFLQDTSNAATQASQTKRYQGFSSTLNTTTVQLVQIDATTDSLDDTFDGCPYQAVMLGAGNDALVQKTLDALESKGCSSALVGTFGTSTLIHQAVSAGKLLFAVSQQSYLQGAMSVVHAALYVTTGKHLAPSSESQYGMILSGPEIITSENALTDTFQVCEADAFPVCPNDKALDGVTPSACACTERPKMKIAGVLHAVTTDAFWDIVYTAANQAADDFGVALELDRMEPDDADILHEKMANQIEKLCSEGVDGIFVTIPSEAVLDAIRDCQRLKIPVVSINAGPDFSADLGLQHHLGMVEFNAGYLAGRRMIASGQMTKGVCLDHAPGNVVLIDRCGGFQKAVEEANIPYLGQVTVPDDNANLYQSNVETFIKDNNSDEWTGLGVLLGGTPQHVPGLMLKDNHPEITVGTFDTSDAFYEGLDAGKIMFGMDQGPYLQGYLPVPLLAWQAQTMQNSVNHLVESGPDFVVDAPSQEKQTCEAEHFKSCDWVAVSTGSDLGSPTSPSVAGGTPSAPGPAPVPGPASVPAPGTLEDFASKDGDGKDNKGAIIALSIVAVVCLLSIAFLGYRMHLLKNYVHRLEEGQRPNLSAGDYVASAFMPAEKIIRNKSGAIQVDGSEPSEQV